jgi:hypothetical protein
VCYALQTYLYLIIWHNDKLAAKNKEYMTFFLITCHLTRKPTSCFSKSVQHVAHKTIQYVVCTPFLMTERFPLIPPAQFLLATNVFIWHGMYLWENLKHLQCLLRIFWLQYKISNCWADWISGCLPLPETVSVVMLAVTYKHAPGSCFSCCRRRLHQYSLLAREGNAQWAIRVAWATLDWGDAILEDSGLNTLHLYVPKFLKRNS